jgi:hypothetical protein
MKTQRERGEREKHTERVYLPPFTLSFSLHAVEDEKPEVLSVRPEREREGGRGGGDEKV